VNARIGDEPALGKRVRDAATRMVLGTSKGCFIIARNVLSASSPGRRAMAKTGSSIPLGGRQGDRAVEERLAVPLFHRTMCRHSLTEAGQTFYEHCQQAMAALQTGNTLLDTGRRRNRLAARLASSRQSPKPCADRTPALAL